VRERLSFLVDVGLDYLTLNRSAESLLGRRGAAHPARHADRLAPRRRALHPRRAEHRAAPARQRRLLATLKQLRDLGNTVIVVEHDEETMREADHLIDLGPGAGKHGGHVIAAGPSRR
jgi:excinuclease ABC subunit A